MTKFTYRRAIASNRPVFAGWVAALALCFALKSQATSIGVPAAPVRAVESYPALDAKRLFALGMIETGNDDRAVGLAGEISRYQLSPSVWKVYSHSADFRNPDVALQVARLHWNYLAEYYKEKTGRMPTDYDMYVLWNTRYGYYAHHNFSQRAIGLIVQDRASRFVNLVNRKD